MRLFVSVDLDGLAPEIEEIQELFAGADGLRFTDPEQAHVTVKFLGETDEKEIPKLKTELEAAIDDSKVDPFDVEFGGLGVFPHLDYISVVWVGTRSGGDSLTQLHEAVERRATAIGFEPEDHDFTPHATIARMDHAGGKEIVQDVVENRDPDLGTLSVTEIRLKESILTPEGPEYSTLERFGL